MKPVPTPHQSPIDLDLLKIQPALAAQGYDTLDREFAAFLLRLSGQPSSVLALAAATVSRATRAGHVCLDLQSTRLSDFNDGSETDPGLVASSGAEWIKELQSSPVVGQPTDAKPLILDSRGRLYLQRYWQYENIVTEGILSRSDIGKSGPPAANNKSPSSRITEILDRYFPAQAEAAPDRQRQAVEVALTQRFCVISGGPGTGKTHTIAILLAALLECNSEAPLRIALSAPTGKAAARLQESVSRLRDRLPCPTEVRNALAPEAATLHRLLGAIPGRAQFRHDANHPLPFDVVIVDEASMVDLALMARLFLACRSSTRIILVGDMDQLASVEPGAVLGDICQAYRERPDPDPSKNPLPTASTSRRSPIVTLTKAHRFAGETGLGELSREVNQGNGRRFIELLNAPGSTCGTLRSTAPRDECLDELTQHVARHLQALGRATNVIEALHHLAEFRILCALRTGPWGVEALNRAIELRLRQADHISTDTPFYPGRPILILKNDYNLRLYNGDVGLLWPDPKDPGSGLQAWFLDADGNARPFRTARLPEHETVFAMSVHKSQGSEFQRIALILPDQDSPLLTREMIYTGITRARREVELWAAESVVLTAIARQTQRSSGLTDRLRAGLGSSTTG